MISALVAILFAGSFGGADHLPPDSRGHGPTRPRAHAPPHQWNARDWQALQTKVRWAVRQRLDTLPVGQAIARLGATFVGTKYTPGTLEEPGPEHVVVNLRALDCVTFIENVLALIHFARKDGVALLGDRRKAEERYRSYLQEIRYRGGTLAGYPSRLHYFSEWLADHAARGQVTLLAQSLGGVPDTEPIRFMSEHRASYRQLADSATFGAIQAMEARLRSGPARWYLPEDRIAGVADRIKDGDLIAATSTLPGLDVAHTGIALWKDGKLHLLHAPLVGKSVEISELPLADRILSIKTQDGIMVGRWSESW